MIVVGCDPGLADCGWAVVDTRPAGKHWPGASFGEVLAAGTISTTPATGAETQRLDAICRVLFAAIDTRKPSVVAIEAVEVRRQRGGKINPASLLPIARLIGRVEGYVSACLDPLAHVVRASDWRRAIGAGHGTPAEVRAAVERHVKLPARCSIHAVEAVALALFGARLP